jgi:histidine triad (HIT) family protein
MQDCIFCKIIKKEIPSGKIYEDEVAFAFLDINPVTVGHTLVVPKKHFQNIYDLPEDISAHLMRVVKKISTAFKKSGSDGINVIINNEKIAGQVIPHYHIHVIPRFTNDNLSLPLWPTKKYKDGELEETVKKISSML